MISRSPFFSYYYYCCFICLSLALVVHLITTDALVLPPALVHTAVGAIAGSTGAIAAYPIDFVKSQLQTEEGRHKYKGGFDAAVDIVRTSPNGPFALYKGLWINVIGIAPEKTIKLSANSMMRGIVMSHFGYMPIAGEMAAGGFAGMMKVLVTNPLEVVKLKLQTSQMSVKDVFAQIQGVPDLYQGVGACIARDVIFSAILFPLYAHLKVALLAAAMTVMVVPGESAVFWANLLAGSFAAGPAALLSTPADVVKTRLQQAQNCVVQVETYPDSAIEQTFLASIQADNNEKTIQQQQQQQQQQQPVNVQVVSPSGQLAVQACISLSDVSFLGVLDDLVQTEGPAVLFSGWLERVVRSVPQFGVTLAMFDLLNTYAIEQGWLLEVAN